MRFQQLQFLAKPSLAYGGRTRAGRRKIQRPFDSKRPLHIVFRSARAKGQWSFLHRRHKGAIHLLLLALAASYGVKIYRYENVGNHIQLLARLPDRKVLRAFLRVFPQRLMFLVTGARKGQPKGCFFDAVAYTRVVEWGREFRAVKSYLWKSTLEAFGFERNTIISWRKAARDGPLSS